MYFTINAILKTQYYPLALKVANVISIKKPNKIPKMVDSYRPISLLPGIAKIVYKILLSRVRDINANEQIIPPEPYGFRKDHSTVAQIINIAHTAKKGVQ